MNTVGKIFIGILFVLANVFLGLSLQAVSDTSANPKNELVSQIRMHNVYIADNERLQKEIAAEQAKSASTGDVGRQVISYASAREEAARAISRYETEMEGDIAQVETLRTVIEDFRIDVRDFASSMRAFQESLDSMTRRSLNLMGQYMDLIHSIESLRTERERVRANYMGLLEEARSLEEQIAAADAENRRLTETIGAMVRANPSLPDQARNSNPLVAEGTVTLAESGFINFDRGSTDGVARGQRFTILSANGDVKAFAVVTQVRPSDSTARLETRNVNIVANSDRVRPSRIR